MLTLQEFNNPAQAMPQALNPMDLFNQERPGFFRC